MTGPLTQTELDEALMPIDAWLTRHEPADRILDALTFTPKPGDRDLLLWIVPGVGFIGLLYVVVHLIAQGVGA